MEINYSATKDKSVWIITAGVFILFGVILFFIFSNKNTSGEGADSVLFARILPVVLFAVIVIVSWAFSINSYTLKGDYLLINRPVGTKKIALPEIKAVGAVERKNLGLLIRLFGNGGLFGYYGLFSSFKLGKMYFYTTRRDNLILIEMKNNKKYVVSPDDLQLVEAIRSRLQVI